MTAQEYDQNEWSLYQYNESSFINTTNNDEDILVQNKQEIFDNLIKEITFVA